MTIITRFAPSPTGYLHIGGARTALYCWLFARKKSGKFILRIEDTDRERSTPEAIQAILQGMEWLGLHYDEGPYYQTQRFDRYRVVADKFLAEGKAYRCFCSKDRLENLRAEQIAAKQKPRYDGYCRDLNLSHSDINSYVIRFRNPLEGSVVVDDQVHGKVIFQNQELDDLIIARSDGTPTYNFTVVVDDWDMKITHVIRGDDHLNNTPRQINMLLALNATPPIYAHVPMILGGDGKKLSKRHGAVSVLQYRVDGYLPQALLNYLVRLGWSHGDQEIFSLSEMIQFFELNALNKSAAAFNIDKLNWLNQHYLKTIEPSQLVSELSWHMQQQNIDYSQGPTLTDLIQAQRERVKTLKEMVEKSRYFYQDIAVTTLLQQNPLPQEVLGALAKLYEQLAALNQWTDVALHQLIEQIAKSSNLKLGKLAQPLRLMVTGSTATPPIDCTLRLLGKTCTLARLHAGLTVCQGVA